MPLQQEKTVQAMFEASVKVEVGDECSALFWIDSWLQGKLIKNAAPNLWTLVSRRSKQSQTVQKALANNAWINDIKGIKSVVALREYLHLRNKLSQVILQEGSMDIFIWRWSPSAIYMASSAYKAFISGFDKDAMQHASLEIQSSTEVQIFCLVSDSKQVLDGGQTTPKGIISSGMLQYVLTGGGNLAACTIFL